MTIRLNANEVVLKAGDTSQIIENNAIEGKLIVTNQTLITHTLRTPRDFSLLLSQF